MTPEERERAIEAVCSLGIVARSIPAAELGKALRIERAAAEQQDGHTSARFLAVITAVEALVWFVAANDDLVQMFASPVPAQVVKPLPGQLIIPDDWTSTTP